METNTLLVDQIRNLLTDNIPQWYSIKDCVRISGLSESSIRRAIQNKKLIANKVGGKWLVKSVWLEEYLTS